MRWFLLTGAAESPRAVALQGGERTGLVQVVLGPAVGAVHPVVGSLFHHALRCGYGAIPVRWTVDSGSVFVD